jgi:hypothetical protein
LLETVAALAVLPENHGKAVRLQLITHQILASFSVIRPLAPVNLLRQLLATEYARHPLEDPPTNLFTDLVSFYGGDFLIFPGIIEGGSLVLNTLVAAVCNWVPQQLPPNFCGHCHVAISFMLQLSQLVTERLGYVRYQPGTANQEELEFPEPARLQQAMNAVVVTPAQLQHLLQAQDLPEGVVWEFTSTVAEFQAHLRAGDNLLWRKPLLYDGEDYLVISPLTISFALSEFIWRQGRQQGCAAELGTAYRQVRWLALHKQLHSLGFRREDVNQELPAINPQNFCGVYRFDEDKIAFAHLIYNDRTDAEPQAVSAGPAGSTTSATAIAQLLALPQYAGHQVLDLVFLSPDGSDLQVVVSVVPQVLMLVIPAQEFDALSALGETSALDLWKFALAKQAFEAHQPAPGPPTSFLTLFKTYRQQNDSFYFSDLARPNFVVLSPGHAADWLFRAKQQTDRHSALIATSGPYANATTLVERHDEFGPIYASSEDLRRGQVRLLVEGFSQPVWVEAPARRPEASREQQQLLPLVADTIAYWLWQVQADLRPYLSHPVLPLICVRYTYESPRLAATEAPDFSRVADLAGYFQTSATTDTAHLRIPGEWEAYLYGADNEGERVLVKQILTALNNLLTANNLPLIPADVIQELVGTYVPLGAKKKIILLDSNDNLLLESQDLVPERMLQHYDTNLVLDAIVPDLEPLCPPAGPVIGKANQEALTRAIVLQVLLPKLSRTISRYNQRDLLIKLLKLNESLIHARENLRVHTASRIACYVAMSRQVADVQDERERANRTSVAVRCLVEHVSAEQTLTGASASQTDLDELIALMDQIIEWGSVGEILKHGLFELELSVLPTQRIGLDKAFVEEVLEPYSMAKTQEDVEAAVKHYDRVFPQRQPRAGRSIRPAVDAAFLQDYGLSFTRLCEFISAIVDLALISEKSVIFMSKQQLQQAVLRCDYAIKETEFEAAMQHLTLTKRLKVSAPPAGYDALDIMPWRFSRRLSLLRKPLIALHNPAEPNNPTIGWGFRQALVSRQHWDRQIQENRFRVAPGSALEKVLGDIARQRGGPLVRQVAGYLQAAGRVVDTEVDINALAGVRLMPDLGDVDVLVIDEVTKRVYSLECKNMAPSRNITQMAQELDKFFGSEASPGWLAKHLARHQWLADHLAELGQYYHRDLTGFTVHSRLVTAENMLTPYLRKRDLPLPFVTSYAIAHAKLQALAST